MVAAICCSPLAVLWRLAHTVATWGPTAHFRTRCVKEHCCQLLALMAEQLRAAAGLSDTPACMLSCMLSASCDDNAVRCCGLLLLTAVVHVVADVQQLA